MEMTYKELAHELAENLDKLQRMYDRWEASEEELKDYRAYVKKTLYNYRVIEWKNLQQQTLKSSEQGWE